jgi:hypothetical protein
MSWRARTPSVGEVGLGKPPTSFLDSNLPRAVTPRGRNRISANATRANDHSAVRWPQWRGPRPESSGGKSPRSRQPQPGERENSDPDVFETTRNLFCLYSFSIPSEP